MGVPRKHWTELQAHHRVSVLPVVHDRDMPEPPANLLPETLEAWERFWADVPSTVVVMSDWTRLLLAFTELDEYHRCMQRYRGSGRGRRIIKGSKGQMARSPYFDMAQGHLRAFMALSEPFGMDPGSRLRYRIGTIERRPTEGALQAINGEAIDDGADDDGEPIELPAGYIPEHDEP